MDPRPMKRGLLAAGLVALLAGCAPRTQGPRPQAIPPPAKEGDRTSAERPAPTTPSVTPTAPVGPRVPIVRIGIAPEVERARVRCAARWWLGVHGSGSGVEAIDPATEWSFTADGGSLRALDARGIQRGGGTDTLFAYSSQPVSAPLEIDGKRYRGEVLIFAAGGGRVSVVNVVDVESYLRSVVPAEIGGAAGDRLEAVKAQAVAARSYTLAHLQRWRDRGFDLLATVEDQVYEGIPGERADVDEALRETSGVVALHEGRPIEAFYCSTCGGTTAGADEVWGRPPRDYLAVRADRAHSGSQPFCSASPYFRWTETWDGPALEKILRTTLPRVLGVKEKGWGRLRGLTLAKRSESDRAEEVKIEFEHASFTVGRDAVRWVLRRTKGGGLRSALIRKITVERAGGRVQRVKVEGGGFGHGVGMCQFGALGMARAGYDYPTILHHYYPGVRLLRAYESWPG
jgi:stage II sporulation protein D